MLNTYKLNLVTLAITFIFNSIALANDEEFDVDQADSLDFESFHKSKDNAIKVYDTDTGEILPGRKNGDTVKTYEAETTNKPEQQNTVKAPPQTEEKVISKDQTPAKPEPSNNNGQTYEIRQRYAIGDSENTSDTPYTAMNALHKKMAKYCPQGWIKEKEWSVPVDSDYYLHYQFSCNQ